MNTPNRPRILYVQFTNPAGYGPLESGARMLVDAGCDVAFIGVAAADDPLTFPTDERFQIVLQRLERPGWRQKLHYVRFTIWALRWAYRWKPSWVYVSDRLAAPIGLLMRRFLGTRVVYHEHDSPDETPQPTSIFLRLVLEARRRLALCADACVLPNDQRAAEFTRTTGRPSVDTVWNCPRRTDVVAERVRAKDASLRVLYHGTIVPVRLPFAVIDAVAAVPQATLSVVGYGTVGHPDYLDQLKGRAAALGISDRVQFVGTFPKRRELMIHCSTCDVGLSLLSGTFADFNERTMVGASSKVFEYLACGLALLVGNLPDWREAYVDTDLARSCDPESADSIAAALRWFVEHPDERLEMGRRGRQKVLDEWNYERTFRPVLERIVGSGGAVHPNRPLATLETPV
jgi:glycosyltransferase involved in cell wall biosynthesis